jgi:dephospho-CoA kinase
MKIAITGNIGSGKSEAIKFLSSVGYQCISSDQIIKSLYQNDQSRNYILKRIGISDKNYKEEIIKRLTNPAV